MQVPRHVMASIQRPLKCPGWCGYVSRSTIFLHYPRRHVIALIGGVQPALLVHPPRRRLGPL
jgi:hypothetical protein